MAKLLAQTTRRLRCWKFTNEIPAHDNEKGDVLLAMQQHIVVIVQRQRQLADQLLRALSDLHGNLHASLVERHLGLQLVELDNDLRAARQP